MRRRLLNEIRELVASQEFRGWWERLESARALLASTRAQRDELLGHLTLQEFRAELEQKRAIDTLYRAGELEDEGARWTVEAETLENRAYPGIGAFEEQRFRASEAWYRLGVVEREIESASPSALLSRRLREASDEYATQTQQKNRLWAEVESLWDRSTEMGLKSGEARMLAKRVRREAEQHFAEVEARRAEVRVLKVKTDHASVAVDEASTALFKLHGEAADVFGASIGTDFLYFRHRDDKLAYAVALTLDSDTYNVEVQPLNVYVVERRRGVGFLEPATMDSPKQTGDQRFEAYFLRGRKGPALA